MTTLNRDLTLKGSVRASELAPVASVNASGPAKVVIHLKTPYAPLLAQLSDRAGMIMSPTQLAKLGDKFATDPVCVGPFMYQNRVAGDSITVVKSPYYYDKQDVHLSKIVYKVENDAAAAAAALKAGDIQALDGVDPTQLPGILADSSLRVRSVVAGLGYQGITINLGNKNGIGKPYSTVNTDLAKSAKLRQAFEMAIDRERAQQGRLRRHGAARLHGDLALERVVRQEHQVHAVQRGPGEGSRRRVGHLEPDRAPDGADRHRRAPPGAVRAGGGGRRSGSTSIIDSTDFVTSLSNGRRGQVRRLPDRLVGPRRPGRQHLRVRRHDGHAERQRVLEREGRPAPERRAHGSSSTTARQADYKAAIS